MQFFYQFPQRTERLVLISSGGLGHEVSPVLRTAALPGVSALLSLTIHPRLLGALTDTGRRLRHATCASACTCRRWLERYAHWRTPKRARHSCRRSVP